MQYFIECLKDWFHMSDVGTAIVVIVIIPAAFILVGNTWVNHVAGRKKSQVKS